MTKRITNSLHIPEERLTVLKKDVFAEYSRSPIVELMYQRMQYLDNEEIMVYKFKKLTTAHSVANMLKRMIERNNILGMRVLSGDVIVAVYKSDVKSAKRMRKA
jgi:hypothetical protein